MSWFNLEHLSAIPVSGADSAAFVHAQLTADVTGAPSGVWHPAAWCDVKGRVEATILFRRNENHADGNGGSLHLAMPASEADRVARGLGMYTIGRKARVESPVGVRGCLGGCDAGAPLARDPDRYMDIGEASSDPADLELWHRADLRLGFPWLTGPATGRHLPQALGLESLGGLSYRKGCYPGQEIVARAHYLGRVKRVLGGFVQSGGSEPAPGDPILDESGKSAGEVLWGLAFGRDWRGLAVMREGIDAASLSLSDQPVTRTPLESLC